MQLVDVMDDDAAALGRHLQPVALLQRARGVLVAALPMLAHGGAGELVVLGVTFIGLLLVDQLQDGDLGQVGELVAPLRARSSVSTSSGTSRQRLMGARLPVLQLAVDVGVVAGARRIHDVLVAAQHVLACRAAARRGR